MLGEEGGGDASKLCWCTCASPGVGGEVGGGVVSKLGLCTRADTGVCGDSIGAGVQGDSGD